MRHPPSPGQRDGPAVKGRSVTIRGLDRSVARVQHRVSVPPRPRVSPSALLVHTERVKLSDARPRAATPARDRVEELHTAWQSAKACGPAKARSGSVSTIVRSDHASGAPDATRAEFLSALCAENQSPQDRHPDSRPAGSTQAPGCGVFQQAGRPGRVCARRAAGIDRANRRCRRHGALRVVGGARGEAIPAGSSLDTTAGIAPRPRRAPGIGRSPGARCLDTVRR